MKSLVCEKPYQLSYRQVEKPAITPTQLLIKVSAVGICGTDIHAYTGHQPFFSYPRVLGHELCGIVTEVGDSVTKEISLGDNIVLMPYVACHTCPACLSGKPNCCENISVIGVHEDGGFCEYLAVPQDNILRVHDVDNHTAALIEPFSISAHGVRRASLKNGETVLVIGAGPIGLGAAAIAAIDGANVVVADTQEVRRQHVHEQLNLPTLNPLDKDFHRALRHYFNGSLAHTVIDATGNAQSMNSAINHIRHGGKVVFIGLFKGDLAIHDPDFHKKETTLMGSRNATREDFEKVIHLMEQGKLRASIMQTHTFEFSQIGEHYEELVINNTHLLKGVINIQ